jgi:signal transduction histidine kinase
MSIVEHINEVFLQRIQQVARIGYWQYIPGSRFMHTSRVLNEICEIPPQQKLTLPEALSFYIPEHQKILKEQIERSQRTGKGWDLDLLIETGKGRRKWIRAIGEPTIIEGKVTELVGVMQDITSMKELDLKAEEALARLKLSLEATRTGIWDWDITHNMLYWDETMFEIFEVDKNHFPQDPSIFEKLLKPEELTIFKRKLEYAINHGEEIITTFTILTPKGNIKQVAARGMVNRSRSDGMWMTGLNWDVTHEEEQKQLIKTQEAKIISSARLSSLGEMAGGIAHEINNPLAIIQAKTDLLKKRIKLGVADPEFILTGLDKIDETCHRIVTIIKGLRSFSRNSEKDPLVPVKIGTIIKEVLGLINEKLKMSSIELHIGNFGDFRVKGRPAQLGQVFMNMLSNAYDAVQGLPEKWIKLDYILQEDKIIISLCDSGPGISPEVEDKLMQPFFTTKELGKGTGLGLSIAKGIIEDHNGNIWVDRRRKNTCFCIELPLINPAPHSQKNKQQTH